VCCPVVDVDECEQRVDGCAHVCHNSPGSFNCSCFDGYDLDPADNKTCVDSKLLHPVLIIGGYSVPLHACFQSY